MTSTPAADRPTGRESAGTDGAPERRVPPAEEPATEAVNPASAGIDTLDARGIVEVIHRQDLDAWRAVGGALDAIAAAIDAVVASLRRGGRLIYAGAGTSGRLGVLDASECPPTFGVPPELVVGIIAGGDRALRSSIEGAEDDPAGGGAAISAHEVEEDDTVCGIAASGTTPWVLGALEEARRRRAATVLVTCNRLDGERRARIPADHLIELPVGPEVIAGSTRMKAGTATKMVLNMLTTAAMIRLGKVHDNLMVDLQVVNRKLVRRARRLVERIGGVGAARAAELLEDADRDVKTAIVMARRGVGAAAARALLEEAQGRLRDALGEEKAGGTA